MELDLISLKSSAVSSSGFWSVYGLSMPLGSRSSFQGVRSVYFHSCFKAALSAKLQCRQPLPVPGTIAGALCPCPALRCWPKLARSVLVWPFCAMATCVGSLQPLSPSAWRGFVRLTHFSRSALCVAGLRALGLSSPGRPLRPGVYVNLFHLTACTLCLGGCLFFFWLCRDGCVAYSFLYETIIIIHL